jgi:hypothetical protein
MYKTIVAASLLLSSSAAVAQDANTNAAGVLPAGASSVILAAPEQERVETIFDGKVIEHHGFYVAPTLGLTAVNGDLASTGGLRSAWLVNHRFGLGLAVNGFSNDTDGNGSQAERIEGGYAGILLQYVIASNRRLHGSIDATVGGGGACIGMARADDGDCREVGFFAVEPTANLELNLARWARASIGGGYRVTVSEDKSPLASDALNGFVLRSSVAFGRF